MDRGRPLVRFRMIFCQLECAAATRMTQTGHRPRPMFADRQLWNAAGEQSAYPALMLAARTTLPHFSVSAAMSMPKSAGDPRSAVPPNSANRALILGSTSAALISLLSLSMIAEGVFFGRSEEHTS